MKRIYLNLKRFDIPTEFDGINRIATYGEWAKTIIEATSEGLASIDSEVELVMFFPESHLLAASAAVDACQSKVLVGCQGVYREDVGLGGNIGAFTTNRTAKSAAAAGVNYTLIGHCEERKDKDELIRKGYELCNKDTSTNADEAINYAVNKILNDEIKCAQQASLKVLYCIGEKETELNDWKRVLSNQLEVGLANTNRTDIVIAYEPVWAIGPGKTPPDRAYIEKIATFIKEETNGMDIVYGGGLKVDNASMLASIKEINGGLIALTRFTGEIGFYPEEYIEIINTYLNAYLESI